MKQLFYYIALVLFSFSVFSCEKDNYDAPGAGIQGRILDHNGNLLQTEQGSGNMRIKMEELSWTGGDSTVTVTPQYLNVKQDGTYTNERWFAGQYRMTPVEGPFYPFSVEGEIVDIKGTTTKDFVVTPYLNVEWVKEPYLTADNFIAASIRFTRNSKDNLTMPDLNNALFCISSTQYVGNNNKDGQLFNGTIKITNDQEGTTIELKTSMAVKYTNTTYYVRAGICCSDAYKKYNYTDIKTVTVK